MADHTPSRHEKSLGLLTTKFVALLQVAKDGVLDLKVAADTLAVRQKRRIYDITNVLEGIGLIEKKSKNSIQWKGAGPGCNSQALSDRLLVLQDELQQLEKRERQLDQHKMWVQQSIKNISDDVSNHRLAYVTHEDLCRCFKGDTLLAIQAPTGTQLEVPIPEIGQGLKKKYQMHLKSHAGAIYVLLVNKDTDETSPVVVQVPPPLEHPVCQNQNLDPMMASTSSSLPQSPIKAGRQTPKKSPTKSPLRPSQLAEPVVTRMATRSSPRKSTPQNQQMPLQFDQGASTSTDTCESEIPYPTDLLFDPTRSELDGVDSELIDELMASDAFAPLLRLSPPPSDRDYYFNLDDSEGVCDLFDVPLLS